jgi:hypothetical protein
MVDEQKPIPAVDQLPEDPLKMPPPYWRSSGAIFHIRDSLQDLIGLLGELIKIHANTEAELENYFHRHPEFSEENEEENEEFADICECLWNVEHKIKLKAELACLMSAIQAEDCLNAFCVFNVHKDIAESIEKLSPTEKLLIASAAVGKSGVKGTVVYEGIKKLVGWRNAFAHGHCVDRPTKSLRHNHLIPPEEYPGVPSALRDTIDLVSAFILVDSYLRDISLNLYTAGKSWDVEEIRESMKELYKYVCEGNNHVYTITYCDKPV